ncbi:MULTISPECIES: hypothetical protein [Citrobacter]|uniref:hypothetical protein n=1 Tax=Citrobacter TaxID=544 RepID=UPI00124967C3|nr:hypothetical protein [Citrobacter sp. Cu231]MDG5474531.1 hypothetical protein [Citrobacter freundii]MDM2744944.1 hypothetical protein [Citrobacter sp. Cu231]
MLSAEYRGGAYERRDYYWIQHVGVVQVAYYTNDTVDELETGKTITGVWHLTRGDDICHNGEADVSEGPLAPPM